MNEKTKATNPCMTCIHRNSDGGRYPCSECCDLYDKKKQSYWMASDQAREEREETTPMQSAIEVVLTSIERQIKEAESAKIAEIKRWLRQKCSVLVGTDEVVKKIQEVENQKDPAPDKADALIEHLKMCENIGSGKPTRYQRGVAAGYRWAREKAQKAFGK